MNFKICVILRYITVNIEQSELDVLYVLGDIGT